MLGGAALWQLARHAQQAERMRRLGVLMAFNENDPLARASVNAFTQASDVLGGSRTRMFRSTTDLRQAI
jgi:hypothetical protein